MLLGAILQNAGGAPYRACVMSGAVEPTAIFAWALDIALYSNDFVQRMVRSGITNSYTRASSSRHSPVLDIRSYLPPTRQYSENIYILWLHPFIPWIRRSSGRTIVYTVILPRCNGRLHDLPPKSCAASREFAYFPREN